MFANLIYIISIVTTFQLLLLSIVIITTKNKYKTKYYLLAAFLIINASYIVYFLLFDLGFISPKLYPPIHMIHYALYLVAAQLLYFYFKSLGIHYFSFTKSDFLHILPFVSLCVYSLIMYYLGRPYCWISLYLGVIHFLILCYIIRTAFIIKYFQLELRNTNSHPKRINLTWLKFILCMFAIMWLADVFTYFFTFYKNRPDLFIDILTTFSLVVNFIFAVVIVYKGLKQPNIFFEYEIFLRNNKSKLSNKQIDIYKNKLNHVMESQKPYLDPSLSIKDLAEKLSIPVWHLSKLINNTLNQNFFDFISSYRIKEAQHLLIDPNYEKRTILEILYEVGFNSKSSFNDLFKRKTGVTPSAYRKMNGCQQPN